MVDKKAFGNVNPYDWLVFARSIRQADFPDAAEKLWDDGIIADGANPFFNTVQMIFRNANDGFRFVFHAQKHGSTKGVGHGRQFIRHVMTGWDTDFGTNDGYGFVFQNGIFTKLYLA